MPLRRTSHAVYDTQYHLVWCPKYRKSVLRNQVNTRVKELFYEITDAYDITMFIFCVLFLLVGRLPTGGTQDLTPQQTEALTALDRWSATSPESHCVSALSSSKSST
jgi:hypothetical protein